MADKTVIRRIVTCQGSIQLVAVAAAMAYRKGQQERGAADCVYKDYLVFYGACLPEQFGEFADFVWKMAQAVGKWKAFIAIPPAEIGQLEFMSHSASPEELLKLVHQRVGTRSADEIFVATDWQFKNRLFLYAYRAARRICYGDGLGVYFQDVSRAVQGRPADLGTRWQAWWRALLGRSESRSALPGVGLDQGYFCFPDAWGITPPMPWAQLPRQAILDIFRRLGGVIDAAYFSGLRKRLAGKDVIILLTSNLSESSAMTPENEIEAYRRLLVEQGASSDSVVLIKPHPRDNWDKMRTLESGLAGLFTEMVILSDPVLFYLPFEIFMMEVIMSTAGNSGREVRIISVSSACLSLKWLFDIPVTVGFGHKITTFFFNKAYISRRLEHERELRQALKQCGGKD